MQNSSCKKVMVIDDNEIDIFIHTKMIEKCNFAESIIETKSCTEALDFLTANCKDVENLPEYIFLDILMPMQSGYDFLKSYSAFCENLKRKCKVVVLSALFEKNAVEELTGNPDVHRFEQKPISELFLKSLAN